MSPTAPTRKVRILDRETLEVVGFSGGHGGHGAAEFYHIHSIASDSKNNIYLGESFGQPALTWACKGGLR
jgi:predicted DNA-binding protein with PD1-like motif